MRPPVDVDKGSAVRRLLGPGGSARALYAGDDTTDLDAFRGLDESGLDVAVKVAVGSAEMNPQLLTRADIVVDGPGELLGLLQDPLGGFEHRFRRFFLLDRLLEIAAANEHEGRRRSRRLRRPRPR